ncbi:MAG: hypothetical protein QNJ44_22570 [Rhodobacter sp.]|nr:hypothetical protein [Rhodobacter sp.]
MPSQEIVLGPRYAVKLFQLTGADVLVMQCVTCDRVYRVYPQQLHVRHSCFTRLDHIEQDFRCKAPGCTSRTCTWHIEQIVRDGDPVPRFKVVQED